MAVGVGSDFHFASETLPRSVLCAIGRAGACLTFCRFSTSRGGKGISGERGSPLAGTGVSCSPSLYPHLLALTGCRASIVFMHHKVCRALLLWKVYPQRMDSKLQQPLENIQDFTVEFRQDSPCRLLTFEVQRW